MALSPGTRLGHYEIQSLRGAGGMGEVYRALDVRLDRSVAIKILPPSVASDLEFQQRFEREAKAIAALSHPSICALYDVGEEPNPQTPEAGRVRFLVMEYLEGETLEETLRKKALPIDQALRTAIQVADGLDKAHRKGVVHRDLKPGNIMLTPGTLQPKLLDFGLAKVRPSAVSGMTPAATVTSPLTDRGTILGTLQYMAPEQVEGREADHRSDVFAFGAVVYEMATGKRAFEGNSPASVMAAILEREPPSMTTVQPLLPPSLDHVVRRCLAKDPDERWQSAGDVMRELQWVAATRTQPGEIPQAAPRHARRERYLWMAVVAALAIVATGALIARRPPAAAPERRLEITTPATYDPMSLAVSPDGQRVVFVAMGEGSQQLWLRTIAGAASATQPLKGTDGAQFPFWSPDSRSIGFGASGQLKRVDIESGTVNWVANAPLFLGGAWSADGTIIFAPNSNSPLMRVSTDGGEPVAATTLSPVGAHSFPHLLPGGRHFLFYSVGERPGVYLGQVDATASRHLLDATATALYSPTGHLLFVRNGTLYAQRFDPDRLVLSGESVRVSDQVVMAPFAGAPLVAASTSAAGPIVFRSGPAITPYRFEVTRVDAAGNALQKIANEPVLLNPSLSPDGSQMAMFKNRHIWLLDVKTGAQRPLTNDAYVNFGAVWSPDGHRIAYSSQRGAVFDLYVRDATGAGAERQILTTPETKMPTDWSSAGYLLYRSLSAKDGFDIWALSMADGKTFPVVRTAAEERDGQFSPDGNWVAYQSNRTGRYEIWVAPFPFPGTDVGEGGGWQFTFGGGRQTRWGAGGKELFYTAPDGRLMSVPVTVQPGGRVLSPGTPRPLFQTTAINTGTAGPGYLVLSDGSFITTFAPVPATTTPITVLLDWKPPR